MSPTYGAYVRGTLNDHYISVAEVQEVFRHINVLDAGCPVHLFTSWKDICYRLNDFWNGNPVMMHLDGAPKKNLIKRLSRRNISRVSVNDFRWIPHLPEHIEYVDACFIMDDFGDHCLELLLKRLPNLKYLSLSHAQKITNDGIEMIAQKEPNLQHLAIYNCKQVDSNALSVLERANLRLKTMCIAGCVNVSDFDFYNFAQNQPDLEYAYCTIDWNCYTLVVQTLTISIFYNFTQNQTDLEYVYCTIDWNCYTIHM